VPRQNSTVGKTQLFGISKRGDKYIRTLFVHGARAVLRSVMTGQASEGKYHQWLTALSVRRGVKRASAGLVNKTARIAGVYWLTVRGTNLRHSPAFDMPPASRFFFRESRASGPPNAFVTPTRRLPRVKRMGKRVGPAFGKPEPWHGVPR
jgi:hypothetical protein